MRLVSALLFVALTGSVTLADEAKPADPKPEVTKSKVPLRVVRMLPETHQVLLHDRIRGTHVVAEVGQDIDGFIVDDIAEDEVTLVAPSGAEVILTAPDLTWRRRAAERKAAATKAAATGAPTGSVVAAPAPSMDAPPVGEAAPQDPYADVVSTEPVRVASAGGTPAGVTPAPGPAIVAPNPADPYEPGITAFADAVGAGPAPAATDTAPPAIPAPAPAAAPAPAQVDRTTDAAGTLAAAATGAPAPLPGPVANSFTVPRADVDAALADFGATAITFDARFVADGLRLDSIAEGTLLAKAGLKKGDTITAIDGKPLRSFDDAADLYARMPKARAATIAVVRGGKPLTLKVAIR